MNVLPLRSIAFIILALAFSACSPQSSEQTPPPRPPTAEPQEKPAQKSANAQTPDSPASTAFTLLAINQAQVSVKKQVEIAPTNTVAGMKVPTLAINKKQADYVQVLRCVRSYTLRSTTGEPLDSASNSWQRSDQEWAWRQAINDHRSCKVAGTYVTAKNFADLAAKTGEFYYVVNPCISRERSKTAREGCSFQLAFTSPLEFKESHNANLLTKTSELANAEAALNAALTEAQILARKIEIHLRACEDSVAHDQQMLSFKMGLLRLGSLIAGYVAGSMLPGIGSANTGIMAGMMAQQMAPPLLASKVFKLPAYIENECINPEVIATTAEERAKADVNAQYVGSYEEEFQVQSLIKKLATLLEYPAGTIATASQRVQDVLKEMHALDSRTVTTDEAIAQMANAGLDPNDPASFSKLQP